MTRCFIGQRTKKYVKEYRFLSFLYDDKIVKPKHGIDGSL